jgi:hypothetical protein
MLPGVRDGRGVLGEVAVLGGRVKTIGRAFAVFLALDTLVALLICFNDPRLIYFAWAAVSAVSAVVLWGPLR